MDLSNPANDLADQLGALYAVQDELPTLRAAMPDFAPWWAAMEGILDQALGEIGAGTAEGMDEARRAFLETAEAVMLAGANVLSRAVPGGAMSGLIGMRAAFWAATRAAQALHGSRQDLSWVASLAPLTGRLPVLRLSAAGQATLTGLRTDPLHAGPLDRAAAATALGALAEGLIWRA